MRVDKDFQDLIPGQRPEELRALEKSIESEGCRDALVVWKEGGILLDGHNRFDICKRLGKDFAVVEISLPDRGAAETWIDTNQLSRRNLTREQHRYLIGRIYERQKRAHGGTRASNQNDNLKGRACESVAERFGIGQATVVRAAKDVGWLEDHPKAKRAVLDGESTVTKEKRRIKEEEREKERKENEGKVAKADSIESLESAFSTIVIDPPWDWGDEGDVNQLGRAKHDYSGMSIEKISEMPIGKLADENCHLYLWITNRSLPKGFALIEKWGFRYITTLTWCKPSYGMGNYFRGSTEHILFAVRGSMPIRRKDVGTWFQAKRGKKHSSKPDEFYSIVQTCSHAPYLDVFGRKTRKGWTVWGEAGVSKDS